jgi:hypothetical protein
VTNPSQTWQGRTITDSPVPRLLATHSAIVLERLAFAAGTTNWYHCPDHARLAALTSHLNPGSVVSFYFDDRVTHCRYTPDVHEQMLHLMRRQGDHGESGEIVVGQPATDDLHIDVDYPSSPEYLDEITQTLPAHSFIYYGPVPGRDNDGTNAVTLTLPDLDGITRAHPH